MTDTTDINSAVLSIETGLILLAILSVAWVGLGIFWGRKAKDLDGFMLAGRNVGLALGAATAMATWVTSNTIMLAPKFALQMGIWGMLAYSTASFGLLLFAPMAERIRSLMPHGYTSGDFIRLRYGRFAWVLFLIISLVYSLGWLVSMAMAGGIMLEALAGIPYVMGMSVIVTVCVLYTLFGGLYAVIGTDFVQSIIILVGVLVVGAVVLFQLDMEAMHTHLLAEQPELLNVLMPVALISLFNNMFFGFGEIFHNNVWWSRAFAMRRGVAGRAYLRAALFWLPIPVAAGFIGLAAGALGINVPDPDMVGPLVASKLVGTVGTALVFIVVFCSLASSIDSLLAATSDLLVQDVYHKWLKPSADEAILRRASTAAILILGLIAWALAAPRLGDLIQVLFLSGPLVASAIWPVLTGLYFKRVGQTAAAGGMLAGSIVGLFCYFNLGWYTASLISAAVSMVVVTLVTALKPTEYEFSRLQEGAI
ncbi:MAG: sodium:solute symporter family protein [Xanthomonadales bacterium]|nr:sodium:solute symporter family protein [Xanthomonadales bacterium]